MSKGATPLLWTRLARERNSSFTPEGLLNGGMALLVLFGWRIRAVQPEHESSQSASHFVAGRSLSSFTRQRVSLKTLNPEVPDLFSRRNAWRRGNQHDEDKTLPPVLPSPPYPPPIPSSPPPPDPPHPPLLPPPPSPPSPPLPSPPVKLPRGWACILDLHHRSMQNFNTRWEESCRARFKRHQPWAFRDPHVPELLDGPYSVQDWVSLLAGRRLGMVGDSITQQLIDATACEGERMGALLQPGYNATTLAALRKNGWRQPVALQPKDGGKRPSVVWYWREAIYQSERLKARARDKHGESRAPEGRLRLPLSQCHYSAVF
ncbi:hypothetical protein CYMTET_50835 [Cymbomonas tetramitiformis]|uniref:Uncharacterized protein n=1 Tax=Cymbomonas tetramitiformis TaxID=36881 RepID=A0AAE0BMH1_9CHLO|nr:hypothetical protein CYMTET_50835 [Cymbomonas tetramitiformis]